MTHINFILFGVIFLVFSACGGHVEKEIISDAPIASKEEHIFSEHGNKRIDYYQWMRLSDEQKNAASPDEQTQKVLDYLNEENAYTEKQLRPTEVMQDKLYEEMIGRLDPIDASVPIIENGYAYYDRYEEGQDYALYCRKSISDTTEKIILNGPEMAIGHEYFDIAGYEISPDNRLVAYGIDTFSRRNYTIHFKDLSTGEVLNDRIDYTTGYAVWANDNKTVFYTKRDEQTLRDCYVYKHVLGTDAKNDVLVFDEKDETYSCFVYNSKSKRFIVIGSYQTMATEYRFVDANTPDQPFKIVQPRQKGLEYSMEEFGNDFYIVTNKDAVNFKLMKTPINATGIENWVEVIPHRDDVLIEGIEIFQNYLVVSERKNGLTQIRIRNWTNQSEYYLQFDEPAYYAYYHDNLDFNTDNLRYTYSSLKTPNTVFEFNMTTKQKTKLKKDSIPDVKFKEEDYITERIYAMASDSTLIPISIVYKNGLEKNGKNPLLLYGYGSYGVNVEPYFSSPRISLLDRGFVFAIAHIRGGQEMGRLWYENGKLLKKKNTFTDFISCAEYLIDQKYTSKEHLYAEGGSAGGLLMGAIVNMRPDLWNGVIAAVPFVDVISTMWDETIPLTTSEFDEWGNPKDKVYYDYMLSYSPYDNVKAQNYPNMLVTTGYWDSQVQYWEPAKWVAKLRELKTDNNMLLLKCNMDVGHGGASGRYERYKEKALEYAFLLNLEGIKE